MTDMVFLDTETLGLDRCAPIWEFAAIRLDGNGTRLRSEHFQIRHHVAFWLDDLPKQFADDYRNRFDFDSALWPHDAAKLIHAITRGRPRIVGSNPGFDLERLTMLLQRAGCQPDWHYHPVDVPALVQGYLAARSELPDELTSDSLSAALGINPDDYPRHTALGDVEWTIAQWRVVMGAGVGVD